MSTSTKQTLYYQLMVALIVIGLPVLYLGTLPDMPSAKDWQLTAETPSAKDMRGIAMAQCQDVLRQSLTDPNAAKWGIFSGGHPLRWSYNVRTESKTVDMYPKFRYTTPFGIEVQMLFHCHLDFELGTVKLVKR